MRFAAVRTAGRSVRGLHITAITAAVRTQPLPAPFVTAARRVDALTGGGHYRRDRRGLFRLLRRARPRGRHRRHAGSAVYAAERIFAPLLVGCELTADAAERCGKALYGNPGAKAALDVAVHCALAASRKAPLCELLAGKMRELTTDLTVSAGRPGRRRRERGRRLCARVFDSENQARHRHRRRSANAARAEGGAARPTPACGWTPIRAGRRRRRCARPSFARRSG